jgi:hypothetical protein
MDITDFAFSNSLSYYILHYSLYTRNEAFRNVLVLFMMYSKFKYEQKKKNKLPSNLLEHIYAGLDLDVM